MLISFIYFFAICLVITGIFFLTYIILNKAITRKCPQNFFTVVCAFKNDKNLPDKIYYAFIQANLFNFGEKKKVVVIDFGIDEKTKSQCCEVLGNSNLVVIIPEEKFFDYVNSISSGYD